MSDKPVRRVIPDEVMEVADLVQRADTDQPTPADLRALRVAFQRYPALWRVAGDIADIAEVKLIESIHGTALTKESVKAGMAKLRGDLGYPTASAVERILIDQVVLSWLRLNHTELRYTGATSECTSASQAESWERKLSAAQRRHLRAVESLARVRRLLRLPAIQLNIGAQQVNVADVKRG